MIDINLPLELDDGTSVLFKEFRDESISVSFVEGTAIDRQKRLKLPKNDSRWYHQKDGLYLGGRPSTHFMLRNVDNGVVVEEDWS